MILVEVPERGGHDVDRSLWNMLDGEESFWALVRRGAVGVEYGRQGHVRLVGKGVVGRAIVGGVVIDVVPKVASALAELIQFATSTSFRLERVQAPATAIGSLANLLFRQFLTHVKRYCSKGRQWEYQRLRAEGVMMRGKLDVPGTLHLWAKGQRARLAFTGDRFTHNTDKNRVIFSALREVSRAATILDLDPAVEADARALLTLFSDARDVGTLFGLRSSLAVLAERLALVTDNANDRDMLTLAGVILSRGSFENLPPTARHIPLTWFLDLAHLFETAVRRLLDDAPTSRGWSVEAGTRRAPPIFPQSAGRFSANPDLVVFVDKEVFAVGDVKYKTWVPGEAADDLYQLLAHTAAFEANRSFLVYPGTSRQVIDLGRAATGALTTVFIVRIESLQDDIRFVQETIGGPSLIPGEAILEKTQ